MASSTFNAQMASLRNQILWTNSLQLDPSEINYEAYQSQTVEDLAWLAYDMATMPESETELALYAMYYLIVNRLPELVKEITMPAFFRTALLVPDFYPVLNSLLSDYE